MLTTLYDGLVGVARVGGSEGGRIVPNLATSMPEIAAGGTTYTLRLRGGIRYSNGRPVRAGDFRRALERLFRGRSVRAASFESLVGFGACQTRPRTCDLSRGVRTDDSSGAIVFHLRRPDAEFLYALVSLAPVPSGTPDADAGKRSVPSTGPYTVARFVPNRRLVLVRNRYFHVWSRAARPDGFPDEIEFRKDATEAAAVTAVASGQADVAFPIGQTEQLRIRYPPQLQLHPQQATFFLFLNTRLPPFDDVRVRRAVNYAVDRAAVARSRGGPEVVQPTCQLVPPGVVGRRPYCPYTVAPSPSGEWKAPDLAKGRQLVAASGTAGMKVTVWTFPAAESAARQVVETLRILGYRARLRRHFGGDAYFVKVKNERTRAQAGMWGWFGYAGTAGSSFLPTLSCSSIRAGSQNLNPSFFCDRRIDAQIARALEIQATDPYAQADLWAHIERELVDLAPWVPLFTPQAVTFVSERVGNYQYSPAAGVLLDQLWVR
jgi:peptide/nickel transport system substrate-binding protein